MNSSATVDTVFPGADFDPGEQTRAHATSHLLKAERDIAWLRWSGMALWPVVLFRHGFPPGLNAVWGVYFAGLIYTGIVQWRLRDPGTIRISAWIATIGDPILAAMMCHVTGGLASVFFPFLYFTLLAAAFRFGARETIAVLALNTTLTLLLYATADEGGANPDMLLIAVFYLGFSGALGAMLAGWARENLNLAIARSEELRNAHQRSRSLLHRVIDVQEEERKRIAGDLHDGMGGHLFTLQQGLDECVRRCPEGSDLRERLWALATGSRSCSREIRNLMNELRPTVLDDLGIRAALEEYVAEQSGDFSFGMTLDFEPELSNWRSGSDAMLFRIVQEALLNVRKHADAGDVEITFRIEGTSAVLRIADDGCGFEPHAAMRGQYGLLTMRERAEALGGKFVLRSEPGHGTVISVLLPLKAQQ